MDDTQQSRASDAGAKRKRRSSILKSQRPPRTPFSELEFNVATPTDTAKSRRVSFSKRTGVAEFITNEATTTWKNFYEEHNKSLESSGNDSGANATRQPIGHLGQRIFDQQFEEVEAVDFITSLDNLAARNINTTINVNFTEQLASLECTDDKKLTAPQNNFELSALTDHHSKVFADDLAISNTVEMSGRIDVNFSAVQAIDVKDDLDFALQDLQRQSNVNGPAPFRDARDLSEYIEIELNSTHIAHRNDESDMSITETIRSPKVNVSKTLSPPEKKCSLNWVNDKENNCLEHLKGQTLVFDDNADMSITTALPSTVDKPEKGRTMIFENSLCDLSITKPIPVKQITDDKANKLVEDSYKAETLICNGYDDMSVTSVLPGIIKPEKSKTMIFDEHFSDLSMTKALPAKLITNEKTELPDKSKTFIFDRNTNNSIVEVLPDKRNPVPEKRRTMIFEDGLGDLSMTQPIPAKLLSVQSEIMGKSNLNGICDPSSFRAEDNPTEKRKTILYDDDLGDLSMTKPIPTKLLPVHSEILDKSYLNFKNSHDPSVEYKTEKRKTIVFEDGDLSITKPIPAKLLLEIIDKSNSNDNFGNNKEHNENNFENVHEKDGKIKDLISENMEPLKENLTEKPKTIIFDEENLSMTKPIPTKLLSVHSAIIEKSFINEEFNKPNLHKSLTIVYDNDENITDKSIPTDIQKSKEKSAIIHNTVLFDDSLGNLSITKPIPVESLSIHSEIVKHAHELLDKNYSIVVTDEASDASVSKPIPVDIFKIQDIEMKNVSKTKPVSLDFFNCKSQDVVVYQVATHDTSKLKTTDVQRDTSKLQDNDVKIEPSDSENKDLMVVEVDEDPVKEEKYSENDLQKMPERTDIREGDKDISRNVSIHSTIENVSAMRTLSKKSILCDLLDMSNASMASGLDDKNVSANIASNKPSTQDMPKTDTESVTSEMFYITKDTDSETRSNEMKDRNIDLSVKENDPKHLSDELLPSESVPQMDNSIQKVISEAEDLDKEFDNSPNNRHFEKVVSTHMTKDVGVDNDQSNMEISRYPKSFTEVDNTKQLLDMLSDLTDGRKSSSFSESPLPVTFSGQNALANKSVSVGESFLPITVKGQVPIENKQINEPKRVSIASNRHSVVLSREDLLSNISMAQAALQRSIDMEDSDVEEPTPAVSISPPKKTVRVSTDVVKTLHFEDESISEPSVKSDLRSPLRKTAFGETSYMNEGYKANVIPSYLKDVSDGIKSLMNDLVKPMTDEMPFEAVSPGKSLMRNPSTCSTQIQANLYTSSQIDVNNDPDEMYQMERERGNRMSLTQNTMKSVSFIGADVDAHSNLVARNLKEASFRPKRSSPSQSFSGKVLVFDHENPLNNVLLTPTEYTEVHKYSPPRESQETLRGSEKSDSTQGSVRGNEYGVGNVSIQYNMDNFQIGCQSGDTGEQNISDHQSMTSNTSKPLSIDQSIGVKVTEVKDIEVNTAIAMKKNKELLEVSSSLTLVDDALARSTFDVDIDSAPTDSNSFISDSKNKAPLRVIYKLKDHVKREEKIDSDRTSNDEADTTKAKKRIHSPASVEKCKKSSPSKQNVTPKPIAKMQRLSDSPTSRSYTLKRISGNKSLVPERDLSSAESKMDVDMSPSKDTPRKRPPRKKNSPKKEGVSITVQRLMTEFNVKPEIDQGVLSKQILEALSKTDSSAAPESTSDCERSVELVSSFTSSKNQYKARPSSTSNVAELEACSDGHCDEWAVDRPAPDDASVNVVAKIDMLPFMGSHECEWASSGTDSWSFHLLHARLLLAIRLAHRHHNAARTRVRADTPVLSVAVHQAHHTNDKKNSVAMSCITFACASLRAGACASCARAGDVPALLRRGAAVARRALRWGRAMHDARMHLAYTLSEDGKLVLKVANIPLRCVWEVVMRLELCTAAEVPFPRASDVTVTRVLDGQKVDDQRLAALLRKVPEDWGHVPATIWNVFKYLKSRTPEAEEMDKIQGDMLK